jgi:hypothetical protein
MRALARDVALQPRSSMSIPERSRAIYSVDSKPSRGSSR